MTCGVAMDVPVRRCVASPEALGRVETTHVPGARMSTSVPRLLYLAKLSSTSGPKAVDGQVGAALPPAFPSKSERAPTVTTWS